MGQEGKAIRAELAEMTDRTSVPNIWINGEAERGRQGCTPNQPHACGRQASLLALTKP
jgi:hypothetical protein